MAKETAAPLVPEIPKATFEVGKKKYRFVVASFNVPNKGVLTATEALTDKEVLAYLVEVKAAVIEEVA